MSQATRTIIFMHLPKTGGGTFSRVLESQYPRDQVYRYSKTRRAAMAAFDALPDERKQRYRAIHGHMDFGLHERLPQPATYLTILREPLSRMISFYDFVRQHEGHGKHDLLKDASFADIVDRQAVPDNQLTRRLAGIAQVHDGDTVVTDALLQQAKDHLEHYFSVVGLTNRFDESLILAKRTYGWRLPLYYRTNIAVKKTDRNMLDDAEMQQVRDYCAYDIALYEWAAARFEAQIAGLGDEFQREVSRFQTINHVYEQPFNIARRIVRWTKSKQT